MQTTKADRCTSRGACSCGGVDGQSCVLGRGAEPEQSRRDTLANDVFDLEIGPSTCNRVLGAFVQSLQSLKEFVVAGETPANMAKVWARETLDKTSKLCLLVEELTHTFAGYHTRVVDLVDVELFSSPFCHHCSFLL